MSVNVYGWRENTIEHILENQQYTGCTVNGKSTTVSYKVHKVIENPKEEYQIIPNTQEAIIDENVWLRVQELRKNKRRPTKTNRKSLFSGLVFCADCKSKLHFCAAKSLKRNQEFFRCANYKDGRGSCTIHFIRDVVLEMIVKEAVAGLADFVRCYESVFLYMQKQKCGEFQKKRQQELKLSMEGSRKRIADLDKLFSRIYEDNVIGKLSDEAMQGWRRSMNPSRKNCWKRSGGRKTAIRDGAEVGGYAPAFTGTAGIYRHERAYADDRQQADPAH